ncbi:MAG TPA: hypothetical protein VGL04_12865 [Sporichthyaceae bacterium]
MAAPRSREFAVFGRKTTLTLLTGALVAAGTFGGGAAVWAASAKPAPGPGDQINACAGRHGILRLVHYADQCRHREFPISWNRQGPPGAPGPSLNAFNPLLQAVQAPGTFNVPVGPGAIAAVPGLTVTLPSAGTYLINANVRGVIHYAGPVPVGGHSCWITADLANGATQVTNSQRLVDLLINLNPTREYMQATAPIQMLVTVAAGAIINVRAFSDTTGAPGACPAETTIVTDQNGASTINAVRID